MVMEETLNKNNFLMQETDIIKKHEDNFDQAMKQFEKEAPSKINDFYKSEVVEELSNFFIYLKGKVSKRLKKAKEKLSQMRKDYEASYSEEMSAYVKPKSWRYFRSRSSIERKNRVIIRKMLDSFTTESNIYPDWLTDSYKTSLRNLMGLKYNYFCHENEKNYEGFKFEHPILANFTSY
jgi:hypothetical protein